MTLIARLALAMIALSIPAFGGSATASTLSASERASFIARVKDYRGFVVPICAPELTRPYVSFARSRDLDFIRSLRGSELEALYRTAVREKAESDAQTFFHCDGPPPPPAPGTNGLQPDPRRSAIVREQERLGRLAADMPRFFDAGDAAFAQLIALRDEILSRKE